MFDTILFVIPAANLTPVIVWSNCASGEAEPPTIALDGYK